MPGERGYVLFVAAEDAVVFHGAEVKDSAGLVPGTGCEEVSTTGLEAGLGDGALVAVEGCQAAGGPGIPELYQVVF